MDGLRLIDLLVKANRRQMPQELLRIQEVALAQLLRNRSGMMMLLLICLTVLMRIVALFGFSLHFVASTAE